MTWVLTAAVAWIVVAVLLGLLVGRGIRVADHKDAQAVALEAASPNFVVDSLPGAAGPAMTAAPPGARLPTPRPAAEQPPTRKHGLT
ncbi:MAG: hypothetical protein JWR45_39 [Blastococcus sp.]|jgi:hypothetical protein|nr:hypothetical protein [Blastococcus sp.]